MIHIIHIIYTSELCIKAFENLLLNSKMFNVDMSLLAKELTKFNCYQKFSFF